MAFEAFPPNVEVLVTSSRTEAAISAALTVAQRDGVGQLPCPVCAAALNAENLHRHLTKVHAHTDAPSPTTTAAWSGTDRRMLVLGLAPPIVVIAGAVGVLSTVSSQSATKLGMGVAAVLFALACVPGLLAAAGRLSASLTPHEEFLELRYAFGLLSTRIAAPFTIEAGQLRERRIQGDVVNRGADYNTPTVDVRAGTYIRLLGANGTSLVIGAAKAPGLRNYWDDACFTQGSVRRRWDTTVDAATFTQLQYELARRGSLSPRSSDDP